MAENEEIFQEQDSEPTAPQKIGSVLGFEIMADTSQRQKILLDPDTSKVTVNPELFKNIDQAQFVAMTMAMRQLELTSILRAEKKEDIKKISESNPEVGRTFDPPSGGWPLTAGKNVVT